ncbi:MAG: hypothetical protein AB7I79_01155 [Rhizobiaceae bacterium]
MLRVATIPAIVAQHAEEAAFLWLRRRHAIDGHLLDDTGIGRIDQRLEANVEGLEAAGLVGWELAKARFADYAEPGETFVIGVLAMRSGSVEAVAEALDLTEPLGRDAVEALSGAVARAPREALRPFVADWVRSRDPLRRCIGLAALWHHRVDAGPTLGDCLSDDDAGVRIRALKLAGRLKRREHLPLVIAALGRDDPIERLEAAAACCLLGDAAAARPVLDRIVLTLPELARRAMEIRLLATPAAEAKRWLQSRLEQPLSRVDAVASIGLLGDTAIMPWLIDKMRDKDLIVPAGDALRDLFAIDFGDTAAFISDPSALGPTFADREETELPSADWVEIWWKERKDRESEKPFLSMRRQRLDAMRAALREPELMLANWRRTRAYPAWL